MRMRLSFYAETRRRETRRRETRRREAWRREAWRREAADETGYFMLIIM